MVLYWREDRRNHSISIHPPILVKGSIKWVRLKDDPGKRKSDHRLLFVCWTNTLRFSIKCVLADRDNIDGLSIEGD